ncbi:MAG: uroporphyrinogen decarboxylase [Bacteroidaceae bacterium]|nr:uroporphyrinogen decarboxylase [Bacteroidaceae bacterium]
MTNIFIDTLNGKECDRPPVWLMRQAGRVLPSYMQMRQSHSFHELMSTPELAAKVTMLPVTDLGVDAAILFSDILTIPVAMGMNIDWTDRGPVFTSPLCTAEKPSQMLDIQPDKLNHVYRAIDIFRQQNPGTPIIGFCGAPLTTMCYMLQGASTQATFPRVKHFFYTNREEMMRLTDAVTSLTIDYARKQVEHGVDAFQIFESHAGLLPADAYKQFFLPAVERISKAVREMDVPVIFFPKGLGSGLRFITPDICNFVSIDWQMPLLEARRMVHPEVGLQGNFDPHLLFASQADIAATIEAYKPFFREHGNWIANLGHGVLADTPFEKAKFMINWIKETNWK